MKNLIFIACALCVAVNAVPLPVAQPDNDLEVVQIPLQGNKELDIISLAEDDGHLNERNKRTIGILRELFPELSKIVEQKIQMILPFLLRTLGPIFLRSGLGGGGGAGGGNTSGRNNDFDDDDDDDDDDDNDNNKSSVSNANGSKVAINGDDENSLDMAALTQKLESINRVVRAAQLQQLDGSDKLQLADDHEVAASEQQTSESKSPAIDELSLDSDESDDNRNKRFLNFGGSSGGGAGGGSGNFLFDIIRRTADRAARAAGTVYRVVAGTESLGINDSTGPITTTNQQQKLQLQLQAQTNSNDQTSKTLTAGHYDGLVSGSSGTEQTDEKENAPVDDAGKSADGYTEGIPGPVTRLFVLANRGLANLIQDLILRVAQTSERLVNFKARLVTSLI